MHIKEAQKYVSNWCDKVFPERTMAGTFVKFFSEIGEMTNDPKDVHEYADVLVLLLDLAEQNGVDIEEAFIEKMKINENRKWIKDPVLGIMNHVKENGCE
mgnify:FL=1